MGNVCETLQFNCSKSEVLTDSIFYLSNIDITYIMGLLVYITVPVDKGF